MSAAYRSEPIGSKKLFEDISMESVKSRPNFASLDMDTGPDLEKPL
jgi:hypothetical protein